MLEIKIGKRFVGAFQISQGALEYRARSHIVSSGLMMKSHRHLNQTLDVATQVSTSRVAARSFSIQLCSIQSPPNILKNLMRVEEMGAVEQLDSPAEFIVLVGRQGHNLDRFKGTRNYGSLEVYKYLTVRARENLRRIASIPHLN